MSARILNFGSLNVDHVYRVPHIVVPGETLASDDLQCFAGGKGANQSVALARAGAAVWHGGRIGADGRWLLDTLTRAGVNTAYIAVGAEPTGHAIIQVDTAGENAIVLFGGANRTQSRPQIDAALAAFEAGDWLLLQNEIDEVPYLLLQARRRGLRTCLNTAPYGPEVAAYPLDCVDLFVVNETEGAGLTGCTNADAILAAMARRFPDAATVLTLGARGARYAGRGQQFSEPAVPVSAVDTTAAGDAFIGYFLADSLAGASPATALRTACRAAAIAVARPGAADSIPFRHEVPERMPHPA
jgi:ribokinase